MLTEQVKICGHIWVFGGGDSTPFSQDGVQSDQEYEAGKNFLTGKVKI